MHKYVHTLGAIPSDIEAKLLNEYVDYYLFSLIMGLRQSSFGFNTVSKTAKFIRKLRQQLGYDRKLLIDSGGYSIIVGDVPYRQTKKCIECYNYYLDTYAQTDCDYILSLDIPIFLNEPKYNTAENIYKWNYESIKGSIDILEQNKQLYDKFVYVWHFKLTKQYNMWRSIYDKLLRDKPITNYAIGGLVGLRGAANINYSPFIVPAYKVLKLLYDGNHNSTSLVHILGVYHKYDRFILSFMDKLFNNVYLKDKDLNIKLSFDTVNYTLSGLYKIREMPVILEKDNNYVCKYAHEIDDEIGCIINDQHVRDYIIEDLKRISCDAPLKNPKLISILMISYNQISDQIMTKMIEEENLLELFLTTNNPHRFINQFTKIFHEWETKYPFVLGNLKSNICENFRWLKSAHDLWESGISESKWDQCVKKFAKSINFPFDLSGDFHYD